MIVGAGGDDDTKDKTSRDRTFHNQVYPAVRSGNAMFLVNHPGDWIGRLT